MMDIKLVKIDAIKPSTYNPRERDLKRIKLIKTSLKFLGWLLPIYATDDGEIISGHQRHYAAKQMGCKFVPVVFLGSMDLQKRKALNIVFNRGTNDIHRSETTKELTEKFKQIDVIALAKKLKPIKFTDPKFYRCMHTADCAISDLTKANDGRWNSYAERIGRSCLAAKIEMPVIITSDFLIVNGIGRVESMARAGRQFAKVIKITKKEARFALAMLNYLTMDFDLENRYAKDLRFNSFRRPWSVRDQLGIGFLVFSGFTGKTFNIKNRRHVEKWKKVHGSKILDFGAGHITETNMLRSAGIDADPFEPYRIKVGSWVVDIENSKDQASKFLDIVRSGRRWESLFCSSVLNSVPFESDRRAIAGILAALCTAESRVFAHALATNHDNFNYFYKDSVRGGSGGQIQFKLNYEPGILIGDISRTPKIQKFHTQQEFLDLFSGCFKKVSVKYYKRNVIAVCLKPKKISLSKLNKALELEFDLPYADGSRMGLAAKAKKCFKERLLSFGLIK